MFFSTRVKLLFCSRCPYNDDHYQTKVVPVDASSGLQYPNHYKRFTFKMFAFVDKNSMNVQRDTVQVKYEQSADEVSDKLTSYFSSGVHPL